MLCKQIHICLNISASAASSVKHEGKGIYSIEKLVLIA
jgi:hypothetical protein